MLALIETANSVASAKDTIGAFSAVCLSAKSNSLSATATDGIYWMTAETECDGDLEPVNIHAATLLDTIKKVSGDELDIRLNKGKVEIKAGKSKRTLVPMDVDVTPRPPQDAFGAPVEIGLKAINDFCRSAVSQDEIRPHLSGINLEAENGQCIARASDGISGARLVVGDCSETFNALIPPRLFDIVLREVDAASVEFGARRVRVSWEGRTINAPLIEAVFPDLDRVIYEHPHCMEVDSAEFMAAMVAVSTLAEKTMKGPKVRLELGPECVMGAKNPSGEATEPFQANWDGEPMEIRFASHRAIAACKAMGGVIGVYMNGPKDVMVFSKGDGAAKYIIMPME